MNQHPDSNRRGGATFSFNFTLRPNVSFQQNLAAGGGASSRSEGSERLPSAGRPWPAPYVKRRRLRRHSRRAGGGAPRPLRSVTRQLASAPRQPGALHILPPRRRDYISAAAPPRRRPAPPAGPGLGARQLGGLGARVPLVCAASERGHPYGGARGCCSWQKPLNSAASWPPPGQWSSACSPFPGKCSSRLCPLVAASWDGWSGRFKIKT